MKTNVCLVFAGVITLGSLFSGSGFAASDCSSTMIHTCWQDLSIEVRCVVSVDAPPCPAGTIPVDTPPICDRDGFYFTDSSHMLSCFAYAAATRKCYKWDNPVYEGQTTEQARVIEVTNYKETQDHCTPGPIGHPPFGW